MPRGRFVAQIPDANRDYRVAHAVADGRRARQGPAVRGRASPVAPARRPPPAPGTARSYPRAQRGGQRALLRLIGSQPVSYQDRAHFFAIAAQTMRRILIDHARARVADEARRRASAASPAVRRRRVAASPRPASSCSTWTPCCRHWPRRIPALRVSLSCASSAGCARKMSPRCSRSRSSPSSATGKPRAPGLRRAFSSGGYRPTERQGGSCPRTAPLVLSGKSTPASGARSQELGR